MNGWTQVCMGTQARIQDSEGGGGSYIQKGGFRTGISGADPSCCRVLGKSTSKKKIADSRRGGFRSPPPPVSAHGTTWNYSIM